MSAHTPGPWQVAKGDGGQILAPSSSGRPDRYTQVIYFDDEKYTYQSPGDASLIAAAPEMFKALKATQERLAQGYNPPSCTIETLGEMIVAAIAKAEGR